MGLRKDTEPFLHDGRGCLYTYLVIWWYGWLMVRYYVFPAGQELLRSGQLQQGQACNRLSSRCIGQGQVSGRRQGNGASGRNVHDSLF